MGHHTVTRRELLKTTAGMVAGVWLGGCSARQYFVPLLSGEFMPDSEVRYSKDAVLLGLYSPASVADARAAVRAVCRHLDWSWLVPGDSVFVKLACGSDRPHPAGTSPSAVEAVVEELRARGAGRILVGDQGSVVFVRRTAEGIEFGATRALAQANGLLTAINASGAEPHFFEEGGYEQGYYTADAGFEGHHWSEPPHLPRVIREVDHIVYLPRLSSHALTGYTHGHKLAVGWLREDSRRRMHLDGASLPQRFTELNYFSDIRSRLRLVITLAEQVLLDCGPEVGTLAELDGWVVIASAHLANHDAVSVGVLSAVDRQAPESPLLIEDRSHGFVLPFVLPYRPLIADLLNRTWIAEYIPSVTGIAWGDGDMSRYTPLPTHAFERGIGHDIMLSRAYEILGGAPATIPVSLLGQAPSADLADALRAYSDGLLGLGQLSV
jgi:uncharacterized protein (DUF362 family)